MQKKQRSHQVGSGVSILPRGKNSWRIKIARGKNESGVYQYDYETVHGSAADAELRRAQIIAERAALKTAAVTKKTQDDIRLVDLVEQHIDMMERRAERGELSPTTIDHGRKMLDYARPYLGEITLQTFTRDEARLFVKALKARRPLWSTATIAAIKARISSAITQAVEDNLVESNPLYRIDTGKKKRSAGKVATADERTQQLLPVAKKHRYGFYVRFMLAMGMRRGECCALTWRDVDFSRSVIHVTHNLVHVKGRGVIRRATKSEAGVRSIGIPASIEIELRSLYAAAADRCQQTGETIADLPVLTTTTGLRWLPNDFSRAVKSVLREAKLGALRTHDLRHTMATELLQELPVGVVQRRLGHANPTITMRTYEHALPHENERATAAASKLVGDL